jgi:hypothetical protein
MGRIHAILDTKHRHCITKFLPATEKAVCIYIRRFCNRPNCIAPCSVHPRSGSSAVHQYSTFNRSNSSFPSTSISSRSKSIRTQSSLASPLVPEIISSHPLPHSANMATNLQAGSASNSTYQFPRSRLNLTQTDPSRRPLVLVACGSFSPITYRSKLHSRPNNAIADSRSFSPSSNVRARQRFHEIQHRIRSFGRVYIASI